MLYRLKHIPTGLYFIPSRRILLARGTFHYVKSNLSKTGKVYYKKPSLAYIGASYYDHTKVIPAISGTFSNVTDELCPMLPTDWQIEEININVSNVNKEG